MKYPKNCYNVTILGTLSGLILTWEILIFIKIISYINAAVVSLSIRQINKFCSIQGGGLTNLIDLVGATT